MLRVLSIEAEGLKNFVFRFWDLRVVWDLRVFGIKDLGLLA